jgi:hypothetical protein
VALGESSCSSLPSDRSKIGGVAGARGRPLGFEEIFDGLVGVPCLLITEE